MAQSSLSSSISHGIVSGVAGTVVMTAFQKFIEMPLSGRGESDAPARFAEKVLRIKTKDPTSHRQLNYVTHFSLGAMWGTAFAIAGRKGLRGQQAVNIVFATVYTGDVLLNTALGLYKPANWSSQEFVVDVIDKYVQAQATGAVFDHIRQD
ncbi:MAG: hypothetical protein M3387_01870 [Actinomycetota bacterium]|nr:hypothetical protein [Actinomycetota bacterium]